MHETQKDLFKRCTAFDFQAKNVVCNLIVKDCFGWQTRSQKRQWKIQNKIYMKQLSVNMCHRAIWFCVVKSLRYHQFCLKKCHPRWKVWSRLINWTNSQFSIVTLVWKVLYALEWNNCSLRSHPLCFFFFFYPQEQFPIPARPRDYDHSLLARLIKNILLFWKVCSYAIWAFFPSWQVFVAEMKVLTPQF